MADTAENKLLTWAWSTVLETTKTPIMLPPTDWLDIDEPIIDEPTVDVTPDLPTTWAKLRAEDDAFIQTPKETVEWDDFGWIQAPTPPTTEEEKVKIKEHFAPKEEIKEEITPIEKPKVEELKVEEIKAPTPEELQSQQEAKLDEFNNLLDAWATAEDIQKYANENPDMLPNIRMAVKNHFKNASNLEFFNKYGSYSSEQLFDARNNWDFVIWDEQYALLSPEQRAEFEAYDELERVKNIGDEDVDDVVDINKITKQDYIDELSGSFTSDVRTNIEKITNSEDYKKLGSEISAKKDEIDVINDSIRDIADDIKSLHKWVPASVINWIIADKTKILTNKKNTLINEYNSKLWEMSNFQNQIDIELKVSQVEDANKKWIYEKALDQYNSDRDAMTEIAKLEFEEQSNILAENRKLQNEMILKEFEQKIKDESLTWGKYETDRSWRMIYTVAGKAYTVFDEQWDIVYSWEWEWGIYKEHLVKNADWTSKLVRTYKDDRTPTTITFDATWKSTWTPLSIQNLIDWARAEWQCWEWVNDYLEELGLPRTFGNSYEQKQEAINSDEPMVWWVAIFNPAYTDWTVTETGHLWIVTKIDYENWVVTLHDWNWNWDEKQWTHTVPISQITSDWGWFYNPEVQNPDLVWYEQKLEPQFKKYAEWKFAGTDWDNLSVSKTEFLNQYESYTTKVREDWRQDIKRLYDLATKLKRDKDSGRWKASIGQFYVPRSAGANYKAIFDEFTSLKTLNKLIDVKSQWATFGALSNQELAFLESSATWLSLGLWEKLFNEKINWILDTLYKELPANYRYDLITAEYEANPFNQGWDIRADYLNWTTDATINNLLNR